jgi:hypothetical protein
MTLWSVSGAPKRAWYGIVEGPGIQLAYLGNDRVPYYAVTNILTEKGQAGLQAIL